MLVLSRKDQEAIRISDNIRIVIVRSDKNKVRVAIEAPDDVHIEREELWLRRQEFTSNIVVTEQFPSKVVKHNDDAKLGAKQPCNPPKQ